MTAVTIPAGTPIAKSVRTSATADTIYLVLLDEHGAAIAALPLSAGEAIALDEHLIQAAAYVLRLPRGHVHGTPQ